jgi:serine/threonine protein kinase
MGAELADAEVQSGQVLAGKYRVERVLGAGAMGVVVAAMHLELEERVALKFLAKSVVKDPDAIARFSREARAAAKIKSEHVARVSDVGRLDNGSPYLVMEYLVGTDLDRVLSTSQKPLAIEACVRYLLQACEAIAEAHAIGIAHRDLKPANLFVARSRDGSDCLKVLDFGISKITRDKSKSDIPLTQTTAVMGTPLCMSPEQMNSPRDATPRSDIWSLGAILYELLTRHPPFDAQTITQLAMMIVHDQPPPMAKYRPDVPPGLEAVVRRCLEKDPKKRFADTAELTIVLAPFSPAQGQISAPRARRVLAALAHTEPMPEASSTNEEHGAPTLNPSSSSIARDAAPKLGTGAKSSAGK